MPFRHIALLAGATLIASMAQAASERSLPPEDRIAHALQGRVAGAPTNCIWQQQIRSSRIVNRTAILYEMNDGTIYLNRPTSGAEFLHDDYALVTDTHSPSDQLCNVDIVRLLDTQVRMEMGSIGLGDFVPYPRPPKDGK